MVTSDFETDARSPLLEKPEADHVILTVGGLSLESAGSLAQEAIFSSDSDTDATEELTFDFGGGAKSDAAAKEAVGSSKWQPHESDGGRDDKKPAKDKTVLGLALYALSSCLQAVMLICAKTLGRRGVPVFQQLLFRGVIISMFALTGCAIKGVHPLGNKRRLLALRGLFGFGAICLYLFSVDLMPLSDAMVLSFLAPLWVALLAPALLKEKPSKAVSFALPCCMAGVVLITQPPIFGFAGIGHTTTAGIIVACVQALSSALAKMTVRHLRTSESPFVSVFYLSSFSTMGALLGLTLPLAWGRHTGFVLRLSAVDWFLGIGVGVFGWGSQIFMTTALRYVSAAPGIAMSYLSVVVGLAAGAMLFDEIPTLLSVAGAVLICSCTFLLGVFERRKAPAEPQPLNAPQDEEYVRLPAADLLAGDAPEAVEGSPGPAAVLQAA